MKILVTGAAGFIGSFVAEAFLAEGHTVLGVDDLSSGFERNIPRGIEFHRLDIRSDGCFKKILEFRPQVISHLAAQVDVRKSVADPVWDADVNVLGTIRLLWAAKAAGTRKFIFSSTGGAIYGEQDVFPAAEMHPCRPVSAYGTSKLCAEHYTAYFRRAGGPAYVALRYSNVFGPRQDPHGEAGVVAIFCMRLLSGHTPIIFGDGSQTRDFVYVEDVARANVLAMGKDLEGIYNIGTGVETSVSTLASILIRMTGFQGTVEHRPPREGEQQRSVIDPLLAAKELGWKSTLGLEQGLEKTVQYFRKFLGQKQAQD
jgi:UDP-glucose 4-epimerase